MTQDLDRLQDRIGYRFRDPALLERALTHPSWLQDHPGAGGSNQRLEFLGDAVLQHVLAEALYRLYPAEREGELTRRRAMLAAGDFLQHLAREAGLDACLRLGAGEEATGGRDRPAALEDAVEALLGAVSLDGGHEAARDVALRLYGPLPGRVAALEGRDNPKGRLQERVQPQHGNSALRYELLSSSGADHERTFEAAVSLLGRRLGTGRGTTKKAAEEEAARAGLAALDAEEPAR
jgi:ribonuclease-3